MYLSVHKFRLFECEHERPMGIHKAIVNNYMVCYVIDLVIKQVRS